MKNELSFRDYQPGEEEKVCTLVMDCFDEFVAPGYSQEGIDEFVKYVNPDAMKRRLATSDNFIILAIDKIEPVGVIEIRAYNHVSLLFVKKEYHKCGIGKLLLEKSKERCIKSNPELGYIDVNSSPYAVDIYKKLGFKQTDSERVVNGIRFIPLKLDIC